MIDIKLIRENPELVKENIKKKFQEDKLPLVDKVKKLDETWRKQKYRVDELRSERNKISQEINKAKKAKDEKLAKELIKQAKDIPEEIKKLEEKSDKLSIEIRKIMMQIPNIIHKSVPIGKNDKENKEIKKYGKPKKFNFEVKSHVEIGESLGLLDFDTSADVSGNGFYFIKGELALLNMALINFARDFMVKKGFQYVEPPLMIKKEVLDGVYSTEEIDAMAYKVEGEDLYLIATSEHPLIGQFITKTLQKKTLPVLQTGYSMCFRKEIGSHGIDEKGIYRTHQFNKQEMIVICEPEDSYKWYDDMLKASVEIFKALEIPFRVLECCSGDLADLKAKSCDLEAWSPRRNEYFEITSLTNMEEAQARRLGIKINNGQKNYYAHTLNNTVIATSRALVAILENNQQKDGSIKIPKALHKYTGFKEIKPKKS
ncbi:serine--tRNA ligase [archaeon]|jgi:seryl-tRNA synthetase|nr:serine--tRNA ligase [archaeon]MBT4241896.1 serine--tRNA ligase [archaeon]MBT4418443.1 serine--tRNA ligase [archaeon]